jgi:tetratricopeptide (TPR) repeat protein
MVSTIFNRQEYWLYIGRLLTGCLFLSCGVCRNSSVATAQEPPAVWQMEVRKLVEAHDFDGALRVIDQQLTKYPNDMDIRAWHARVLSWAGRLSESEEEFVEITKIAANDPDNWMGLALVHLRQGHFPEALREADRAVELDPKRADLRTSRAQVLRAAGDRGEAQIEFRRALALDPTSADARSGLFSLRGEGRHELRFGLDNDLFSFTGANHNQWVSLVSRWTQHWTTSAAGNCYQRGGTGAGNFIGSVTRSQPHWGAITVGGGTAHDEGVIPRTEAFFDLDRGFQIGEDRWMRGVEVIYGQHWYWYSTARILTLNETAIVYLPKDWTWSLRLNQARSAFTNTGVDWKPSGLTRLNFPIERWKTRSLSGSVFFAVGTEDFAQVDQIGAFASQTYGGGLRFRVAANQDVTTYVGFQQRTQDHAQTSFGFSYGIRF